MIPWPRRSRPMIVPLVSSKGMPTHHPTSFSTLTSPRPFSPPSFARPFLVSCSIQGASQHYNPPETILCLSFCSFVTYPTSLHLPSHIISLRLPHTRTKRQHAHTITTCLGRCLCPPLNRQHRPQLKSGAVVNPDAQEDKPGQATAQQRPATHEMSHRDLVRLQCHLVAMFDNGAKGPGC